MESYWIIKYKKHLVFFYVMVNAKLSIMHKEIKKSLGYKLQLIVENSCRSLIVSSHMFFLQHCSVAHVYAFFNFILGKGYVVCYVHGGHI